MPSYILIGNESGFDEFINEYKSKESILDVNTSIYIDKFLIETSRTFIKSLAFKSNSKRLFVIKNEVTIEAQNSMLKNIEELDNNNTVIFCINTLGELLPTIHSRCKIIKLDDIGSSADKKISDQIALYINNKISLWELIDNIETSGFGENTKSLFNNFHLLLLDQNNMVKKKAYYFCKNFIKFYSLIEKNNINKRIALEKIFIGN